MDITLVSASNSKEVHGTDNDKKTGCGINLLRGENITVYRRIGRMTDLKEITCERCKASLAKKMIKADKKEMTRLLKEEKQRAKLGMEDEGIVPLGNTTARITRAPEMRRGGEPAGIPSAGRYDAPSAQREIPPGMVPEPNMPENAVPEPPRQRQTIPGTGVAIDDSLAAFAINKPVEQEPEPQQDDFLAQFAVPTAEQPAPQPQQPAYGAAPVQDDYLAQFAVPTAEQPAPQPQQPAFGAAPAAAPVLDNVDDILSMFSVENAQNAMGAQNPYANNAGISAPAEPYQQPAAPVQNAWEPAADQMYGGVPLQQNGYGAAPAAPEGIAAQPSPYFEDLQPMGSAPVLDDLAPVQPMGQYNDYTAPMQNDMGTATIFEDISSDIGNSNTMAGAFDAIPDVSAADYAAPYGQTPQAAKPDLYKEDTMINNDINNMNAAPAQPQAAAQPQIISVPQLAGYDQSGKPVYNYVQMQMTGLDANGQPVFAPVSGQQPAPVQPQAAPAPQQAAPARSAAPKRRPAANPGVPKANVSKIAVNPHAKQTSQAFINAIASSKEYADKNLIDTQGLKANTPILSSIEDVLSTMGDDSAKQKLLAEQQKASQQKNVTSFNEYKGPTSQSNRRPVPPQFRNTPSQQQKKDPLMMTKSELKAYKKQEKIEAKFKKEMAKRGGY